VTTGIGLTVDVEMPPGDLRARVLASATQAARSGDRSRETPDNVFSNLRPARPARAAIVDMIETSREDARPDHPGKLDHVATSRSRRSATPAWWLATAAGLALAAVAGLYAWRLNTRLQSERQQLATLEARMSVLTSPDVVRVALAGQPAAPAAVGRAYMSHAHGLVFTAQHLPALESGRAYQLWVVTAKSPMSVGMLTMAADGSVTTTMPMPAGMDGAVIAVAVTIEPEAGVPAPTGAKVLVGMVTPQ
jgi:hypothetical protein